MIASFTKPRQDLRYFKPQNQRLPKRNAVTIGIGFLCADGIVLCSDTQLTKYDLKFTAPKIQIITPNEGWVGNGWVVATCYSGVEPIHRRVIEKLSERFFSEGKPDVLSAGKLIEEVLTGERKSNQSALDRLEMLFAISISNDGYRLLRSHGKVVSMVDSFHAIGVGDSALIRFLREVFAPYPQFMQASACLMLGTYMVAKAKTFIDGCGGATQAVIIRPDGNMRAVVGKAIEFKEKYLSQVESEFSQLASALVNPALDADFTGKRIDDFSSALKNIGKIIEF